MSSLQEQLLKAGMVDAKKAKSIAKEKRKQHKRTPKGRQQDSETKDLVQAAREEKARTDRALNQQLNEKAAKKAISAQIKQLIESNRIDVDDGDVAYQFSDGKKIKKIFINSVLQNQLVAGIIAIVKLGDRYELVPKKVAEKIAQRDSARIMVLIEDSETKIDEDDPYADYQIPDDLMW